MVPLVYLKVMNHLFRIDNICTIKLKLFLIQRERYSPHKAGSNTICDMSHAAMKKKETKLWKALSHLKVVRKQR